MFDTTMSLCRVGMIHMKDEGWRSWVNWYNRSGWLFLVHFSFYKIKIIKLIFFKKTGTEPKPVQTGRFRLGFLGQKPVQIGLARFFFLVWLGFFSSFFLFGFGFFGCKLIKLKPNRTSRFFQNFNRFFFNSSVFSVIFFLLFLIFWFFYSPLIID
jgi:hypothetical protein